MNEMTIDVFEQLYREYHSRLYHYALHLTHDAEAASDVVAEVFAIAWKRRDALDAERVQGYLYAAVHNQSLNWLRRQERLAPMPDSSQHDWTDEDLEEVLAREARIKEIEKVIASMTERTRYVFIQCYYQKRNLPRRSRTTKHHHRRSEKTRNEGTFYPATTFSQRKCH